MNYIFFVDLSNNRLESNMEDVPVPSENTFDVTLPATHSVSMFPSISKSSCTMLILILILT